jgi:predicted DsbA family dithiol-disulfide isomerase
MSKAAPVRISVWSDYVCPFCYLELPVLDELNTEYQNRLEVDWRAFELRPEPVPTLDPDGDYLHQVWGQSVYPMAEQRGMTLRLPPLQPRSRKAHEAAAFAKEAGLFEPLNRVLFQAFFEHGRDISNLSVLQDLAHEVGLDPDGLKRALESGRLTGVVLEDQRLAQDLGISGVPALVISRGDTAYLLSGAQPLEAVRATLERPT